MKVAVIGGGGARTPLLVHGLAEARERLSLTGIALFDADPARAELMRAMAAEIAGPSICVEAPASLEETVEGANFVVSSIRVGGIAARARDERIAIEHGMVGQETTGAGGLAMALRTVPVVLEHARVIERVAPDAWLLNLTNPAGLVTQAILDQTRVRAIGICDTPSELFHRIAAVAGRPVDCAYSGLNHLGWVSRAVAGGEDVLPEILADDAKIDALYPARLFDPAMIRALGLIPSEYLFFVYARGIAYRNQRAAGASRGEELLRLNTGFFDALAQDVRAGRPGDAVLRYKRYLNQRNASYMRLEAGAESVDGEDVDPFAAATGYHRIALDTMTALVGAGAEKIVVNVRNGGAIPDLDAGDVVEVPCSVGSAGARPLSAGVLPATVRGLVQAVKAYEYLAIRAALERSLELAKLALTVYPIVGEWAAACDVMEALME